jgi:hypothetical protein
LVCNAGNLRKQLLIGAAQNEVMELMKMLFVICFLGFVSFAFGAARLFPTIDLDNPEFPYFKVRPGDLSGELLEKYSVGNVIVEPRIWFSHQTVSNPVKTYHLGVYFFSKTNTSSAVVKSVSVSLNDEELPYGKELVASSPKDWRPYAKDETFYICSVEGEPIDQPETILLKAKVDVSLLVEVTNESGEVTRKSIEVNFMPKRRRAFKW